MITRVTKPELDKAGKICGTRIEYRIFGLLIYLKRIVNPKVSQVRDEPCDREFYTKF